MYKNNKHFLLPLISLMAMSTFAQADCGDNNTPATTAISGLWLAEINVNGVSHLRASDETPIAVPRDFPIRAILHVDEHGAVHLLREATVVNTTEAYEVLDGDTCQSSDKNIAVVVINPRKFINYPDIGAEGRRYTSKAFEFGSEPNSEVNDIYVNGSFADDASLNVTISHGANHQTNPFKHTFHPQHGSGREITRELTFTIAAGASDNLKNIEFSEQVTGLAGMRKADDNSVIANRIAVEGNGTLSRVSTAVTLVK